MIIYTDLYSRTKNYSLPEKIIKEIESSFNVTITTNINPQAEIYWGDKLTSEHLEKMPNIKWIHLSKTGYDKFNLPKDKIITNTPESSEGVAEYALTAILHLARGLDRMTLQRDTFDKNIDYILPFNEIKCLIVGYGRIGKKLKKMLDNLEIYSGFVEKDEDISYRFFIEKFHFIINCLPLNNETKNYFNEDIFGSMDKNSYIINVGRGETINEDHLYKALKQNVIRGAFLDVVQKEPISLNNKLLELENVFISPHIANATKNSLKIQQNAFETNLRRYINKETLRNII